MSVPITVRGEVDEKAIEQLKTCTQSGNAIRGALSADGHLGYSMPIGGAVAYVDHISSSGVGFDIGCGNKAVATNLFYQDIREDLPRIMDEIVRRISFGVGRINDEPIDHPVLNQINTESPMPKIHDLLPRARKQLGTVGAGNHYVDLFREDRTDRVWIGVHFGSRGFGHSIASGFLALSQGLDFNDRASEGEMSSPPVLFHVDSSLGHLYIEAMTLAGDFAYAGRDIVCDKVLEILGATSIDSVHNHHNYAWLEEVDGQKAWVVRKGCTPAYPGQRGFVGATMGEPSVILEGIDSPAGPELLWSTVHGAGRLMSRTQAAGKSRKRWSCANRDCDWQQKPGTQKPEFGCPKCGHPRLDKRWVRETDGLIDWDATLADLSSKKIELRGGAADEAPGAYKRLDAVLGAHADTIRILKTLIPIGVAMASSDTVDPWKD